MLPDPNRHVADVRLLLLSVCAFTAKILSSRVNFSSFGRVDFSFCLVPPGEFLLPPGEFLLPPGEFLLPPGGFLLQAVQQQAALGNKKQREVYVGNLAPGLVTSEMLQTLFDSAIRAAYPAAATAAPPVVAINMAADLK